MLTFINQRRNRKERLTEKKVQFCERILNPKWSKWQCVSGRMNSSQKVFWIDLTTSASFLKVDLFLITHRCPEEEMRASSLTRLKTCSTVSKLNIYGDFDEISMSQLQNDQEGTSNIGASLIPKSTVTWPEAILPRASSPVSSAPNRKLLKILISWLYFKKGTKQGLWTTPIFDFEKKPIAVTWPKVQSLMKWVHGLEFAC